MTILVKANYLLVSTLIFALPIAVRGATATHSITIRVSAPRSSVCVGDKAFAIDVLVLNEGESKYSFDSNKLYANAGYGILFDTSTMKRRNGAMTIQQDPMPGASQKPVIIELQKNQAYVRELSLSLPVSFFDKPGFYLLMPSVAIDEFSLEPDPKTGIIFEVRDCE
jgi:hypothetical protein